MNKKNGFLLLTVLLLLTGIYIVLCTPPAVRAQSSKVVDIEEMIDVSVKEVMKKGNIPGLSVAIIKDNQILVKAFGVKNLETKQQVTPETLFELGSCSKSFTALALMHLESKEMLTLDDPVSKFFPAFRVYFRGIQQTVTINHLLHHTSGIGWKTFGGIPDSSDESALQDVVHMVSGTELTSIPGRAFQYSNTNYDVAGAIIEAVSGRPFEQYMKEHLFTALGMTGTFIGTGERNEDIAAGHKIAFGKPVYFKSPIYRGNFPAAYVLSNANDMAAWLKVQLGKNETHFKAAVKTSHTPDPLQQGTQYRLNLYSMGWMIRTGEKGDISHAGMNPNFSAYVGLKPGKNVAVAILANSNSTGTAFLGNRLLQLLSGRLQWGETLEEYVYDGGMDKFFTLGTYVLLGFLAVCCGIILYMLVDVFRGVRHFEGLNLKKLAQLGISAGGVLPLLLGLYFFPDATVGFDWDLALAWAPASFRVVTILLVVFLAAINVVFLLSMVLPYKDLELFRNKYLRPLPLILFLGFVTGLSGAGSLFLISTSFFTTMPLKYLIYYLGMTLFVTVLGGKIVRTKMLVLANDIVYELRMKLVTRIFATRYQMFEKIDSGRIYATLNNDTESISNSAGMVVGTVSSLVTAMAAFVYLAAISMSATLSTLAFSLLLGGFYIIVGKKSKVLMEQMRDTQNVFMKLIEGLVKGFREISLHHNKKKEYDRDVEASCAEYRSTRVQAVVKFINANLFSSAMITVLLATVCISFPRLFPDMSIGRLISYIMVLLYMIGPVTSIMSSFPTFIRIKVSWDRIQKFIAEVPAIEELTHYKEIKGLSHKGETVDCIEAKGITFTYKNKEESESFSVGPIDLKVNKGEILFIVGGNGSGKTTLAKLLTGLYEPEEGEVLINGKKIEGDDYLGEYFSIIFDNFTLFEKLYNIDFKGKKDQIDEHLKLLGMEGKVELKDGKFSTTNLSSGQRKRLALLQCYLEECPIYLFDEVAADQDPEFRKFFYHDLLMRMKKDGKIIIAITHDDHYFNVADQIIKLDMGKLDHISEGTLMR